MENNSDSEDDLFDLVEKLRDVSIDDDTIQQPVGAALYKADAKTALAIVFIAENFMGKGPFGFKQIVNGMREREGQDAPSDSTIRKALNELIEHGVVEKVGTVQAQGRGRPSDQYVFPEQAKHLPE